jgi:hypothetical protein
MSAVQRKKLEGACEERRSRQRGSNESENTYHTAVCGTSVARCAVLTPSQVTRSVAGDDGAQLDSAEGREAPLTPIAQSARLQGSPGLRQPQPLGMSTVVIRRGTRPTFPPGQDGCGGLGSCTEVSESQASRERLTASKRHCMSVAREC